MRAALCREFGTPVKIEEIAPPLLRPGTVRIKVAFAAANPPDVLMSLGKYQVKPPLPFAIGVEGAGVVTDVAPDVTAFRIGDRVMTYAGQGCMAEEVVVAEHLVHKVPDSMSLELAAGFVLVYGTAYHTLVDRGHLAISETVAVLGAAGGIGLCAIQIAKALGARVVAVASTPEKRDVCRDNGADHVIDSACENMNEQLRAFGDGKGVHMVHDTVGGALTLASLRGLRPYGRHMIVGYSSGEIPQIPANYVLLKQVSVTGVSFRQCAQDSPAIARAGIQALLQMWAAGRLRPHVSAVHPFEQFADALGALSSRAAIGKHLVEVGEVDKRMS
jgi:NADPH2:quinone reductase